MSKKSKPQIKRAGDQPQEAKKEAPKNQPNKSSPQGASGKVKSPVPAASTAAISAPPKPASCTPATAPTAVVTENKWTASQGGINALQWLSQKTQGSQPPQSRGAIEYLLSKTQQKSTTTGPATATVAVAAPEDANHAIPKPRSMTVEDTAPAASNPIQQLAQKFPEKMQSAPQAKAPAPQETPRNQQRGQRGARDRRRDDAQSQRERLQRQQEEAQEKHEEAMRTDPEYLKRFQSMQEIQQAMQTSQMGFFDKYSKQENLLVDHIVTERLDIPVILDLIDQHDVVFVCTDTGSGKSTNVPKALLELSTETRVVSTQPRRTATMAIAKRVAELRRGEVGEDVGYWIRGDKKGDEQTRLWYMTSYTLLLRILENPSELPFTHIVLDEFHERQPDIEVTVALLRLALLNKTCKFKLVLMSATLNTEDWEEYFAGLKVATYKQSEPEHPIHDFFLEDSCVLLGSDYQAPPLLVDRGIVEKNVLDRHMFVAQNLIMFLNSVANPNHSILVFLPGRAQVEILQGILEIQMLHRLDVVPWHSAVDLTEIEAAMKRRIANKQKVYLATDIAEVSITLPDVVFVIDLVLVKRPKISKDIPASILYPSLVTQWVSKGSVAQRRGRVGRVQQGFYFCLFPASQVATLPDHNQPPIENCRIDELSLHCLQVVSNPVAIFSLCHGQPLVETIASAMNTLTQLGCIVPEKDPLLCVESVPEIYHQQNKRWNQLIMQQAKSTISAEIGEYQYTFIGRILQLIPVSPQPGMLVFFGFLTGLESLMILAAAVMSSLSPFMVGGHDGRGRRLNVARAMEETENAMRDMCCGQRSDIVAVMKATLQFRVELARHGESNMQAIKQWCAQKYLSYEKLLAIVDLENHIKYELADFMPFSDIPDASALLAQLEKLAAMVVVMTNVAFASQAIEVTSESNTYANSKEMAMGIFSELTAVPDVHSPSCLRWQEGDIIIPVQLNLLFDKLLAGFSTAVASAKQFWMSLLLFTQRLRYAAFSDDAGTFYVFSISYCGKERFVEVDEIGGFAVLEFRRKLSIICCILRLSHVHKNMFDHEFTALLAKNSLKPLQDVQREVISALVSVFNNMDGMTADEVEHEDDDLDAVSLLSFALPAR